MVVHIIHITCAVCGAFPPDAYMVRDDVWQAAGLAPKDHACLPCLERRLGRPLTIDDFAPVPINRQLRFAYDMGRRQGPPPKPVPPPLRDITDGW